MTTIKRFLIVVSVLTLVLNQVFAERVSQEDAATVANNFMNAGSSQSGLRKSGGKRMVLKKAAQAEENQFYVYENADGEGWVMVAANDVVQPILAYSKTGQFNVNNQPSNVKVWLGGYNKQIKFAEENKAEATEEVKSAWRKLRTSPPVTAMGNVVVAPLIHTTWDQDDPYWKYCPKKGSTNTYVGCVATAMAQVMNYWQWPVQGNGSYSYTSEQNSLSCSADFGNTTYDWANMVDHYTTYYSGTSTISVSNPTTAQKDAVATLMYHCGVAVEMDYGTSSQGGSGAQTIYPNASQTDLKCAANALWNNFRYKKSTLKCYYRPGGYGYSAVNDATWLNLLKTELNAARPIMYAGADNEGGHSFVCDGYDDQNYFHFNWGWSGYCDGYYTVNNMVPGTGGSGAGNGSYNDDQDIIIGIIPDKPDITITWSVQGISTTTTQTAGTLVLPANPFDCSGTGGKKFVGWTEHSSISNGERPSDLFTSESGITVTENKTYYAVYATASAGGGGASIVTLNASSDTSFPKDGITLTTSNGVLNNGTDYRIYKGATLTITSSVGNMSSIAFTFDGSYDGGGWETSYAPNSNTWTSPACTSGSSGKQARITQIIVTMAGGGTSYSDYSLVCGTPCSITPTMSFSAPTTVSKTTADVSFTKAVSIENKGSGQTVAYSSSDETVATVSNSGVVTLQGKVGSTTITASVEASGTYCAASASYTLNVSAAPIDVTLYYNGTSASLTNQTSPYTLPTGAPYNTAMCSGDWTFAGWYGSTYTKSETEPSYISKLTATGSAYAIYTTTETSGSGGSTNITLNANTDTSFPKDGITLTTSNGVLNNGTDYRIYKGATLTITSSVGNMSSIAFTFDGSYNGGGWKTSYTPNSSTWTSPACTSGSSGKQARITQIIVTVAGGGSSTTYYATSPDCVTPCSITPTMSFSAPTTVSKTTADVSFTKAVTIENKGSGQTVAYSSSDETVAVVNNSGVVTLQGKVGSTTITASVEASGTYCAASASYTLNVSAAPIDVTLYYNGTSASLTNQTSPYTLPTGAPYNTAMCSGDWTFAGWYGNAYSKSTDAPSYITELNATGSAYAVYTTTETSGSGGAGGSVTITTSTANIPTSYGSANTFTEYTLEGYKFKIQQMYLNGGKLQWRAAGNSSGTGTMYNNETFPGKITSIVLTYNSSDANKNFTVKVGDSANPSSGTSITPSISGSVYTFDCSSANADYFVLTNGSGAGYLDQIVINYGGGSSSTTYFATSPDCAPTTTYTVTWKACGEVFKSETYAEGAALVLPDPAPEDNAGKSFYGWTETEHHTGASAPADAFTTAGSKTVTSDVTYYAIYY